MFVIPVNFWKRLSEDELWTIAMDTTCSYQMRAQAMDRWLFPARYGYSWSGLRVEKARQMLPEFKAEVSARQSNG